MIEQKIERLLLEKFEEEDYKDCYVVEIKVHPNSKLELFIDSDSGITLEKCHRISRYLESYLDEELWLGEKYVLEVSSPGIDRPLKLKRQYVKNIGRKLSVTLLEGEKKEGVLVEMNDDHLVLEEKIVVRDGKKKKRILQKSTIPFEKIKEAKVKITF